MTYTVLDAFALFVLFALSAVLLWRVGGRALRRRRDRRILAAFRRLLAALQ